MNVWPEPVMIQETDYYEISKAPVALGNSLVSVWSSFQSGRQTLYAQRMDENGQALWAPEGLKLADSDLNQRNYNIIVSSDGFIYVIWQEYQSVSGYENPFHLRAQKLDANGDRLWTNNGKIYHPNDIGNIYRLPKIISDYNGGFFMTEFFVNIDPQNSRFIHINSNGDIISNVQFDFSDPSMGTNGLLIKAIFHSGGYFVALYFESEQYKLAKFDLQGNHQSTPIILGANFYNTTLKQVDESHTVLFWETQNSVKAQVINAEGMPELEESGRTIHTGTQHFYILQHEMASDMSLLLLRGDAQDRHYIVKLNDNYETLSVIDTGLINVCVFQMYLTQPDRNFFIFWRDFSNNLRGQKYSSINVKLWGANGRILQTHFLADDYLTTRFDNCHFAFIWNDSYRDQISCNFLNQEVMTLENEPAPIYQKVISKEFFNKKLVSTQDKSFLIWTNSNNYRNRVYLQITDNNNGQVLWPQSAKRISTFNSYARLINAKLDLQNRLVIWWMEIENSNAYFKIQVVNQNGDFIYPEEGLCIMSSRINPDTNYYEKSSIQFDDNNIYFYFVDYNDDNLCQFIRGQCVNNGNLMWGEQGRVIVNKAQDPEPYTPNNISCKILDNDSQENIIFWSQYDYDQSKIYMLRLNSEGQPDYHQNQEGTAIFNWYPNADRAVKIQFIKQEDKLILFNDQTAYQIINHDGSLLFPLNKRLVDNNSYVKLAFWNNGFIVYFIDAGIWYKDILRFQENDFVSIFDNPVSLTIPVNINSESMFSLIPMHNRTLMVYNTDNALFMNVNGLNEEYLAEPYSISENPNLDYHYLTLEKINNSDALINWIEYISNNETYAFVKNHYLQRISVSSFTDSDELVTLPAPVILKQNYPNPFNPSTKICYTLKNAGQTELSVYNIKGQKVATLVKEVKTAGTHEIIWNGQDYQGENVSSGIYFYRLKSGTSSITKKMILMK